MGFRSFRDPNTNRLKAWGWNMVANDLGDLSRDEPNSFNTQIDFIHVWMWNGTQWVAVPQATVDAERAVQQQASSDVNYGPQSAPYRTIKTGLVSQGFGAQGAQGAQGPQSDTGAQGAQGPRGLQGTQGAAGTGAQGPQGADGGVGSQGTQGAQGAQGAQGTQGTQGSAAPAGAWTQVKKTADQTKTANVTLAADASLVVNLLANTKYMIRGKIYYDTGATGDFKWRHVGPASPTLVRVYRGHILPGTTAVVVAVDTAFSAADIALAGNAGSGYIEFEVLIQNGPNAGQFSFQWAQNASDATATIVRAGSYLEWMTS